MLASNEDADDEKYFYKIGLIQGYLPDFSAKDKPAFLRSVSDQNVCWDYNKSQNKGD